MQVHEAARKQIDDSTRSAFSIVIRRILDAGEKIARAYDRVDLIDCDQRRPSQTHHPEHSANELWVRGRGL